VIVQSTGAADAHLANWTIIVVGASAAQATWADRVRAALGPDIQIAVDLRHAEIDVATCADVWASAATTGTSLVFVEPDPEKRAALGSAGITEVYESLDVALHVTTPPLREAGVPTRPDPMTPASGDALLVASEDAIGQGFQRP
jgi:hypothetical protein